MQIQSLSLSDFGDWKNLSLGNLSSSLNVLHGPNEVGKTTLLRFLREMLYGQKLAREDELLAFPLSQGRGVGICDVETPTGRYRLERTFCLPGKFGERAVDHVIVEGLHADGSKQQNSSQGIAALQVLLSGVDVEVYRNVFAFGIDEVERLATLGQTEAGAYLYDLSAGVDRVSLAAVFRGLRNEREALLSAEDDQGEIIQLFHQRAALELQLEAISEEQGRYRQIVSERSRMEAKLDKLKEAVETQRDRLRVADLAATVRPMWAKMQQAIDARSEMGWVPDLSEHDLQQLQRRADKRIELQQRSVRLRQRLEAAKRSLAELPLRSALVDQGPRIEALVGQRAWIESRVEQMEELRERSDIPGDQRQAEAESLELGEQLRAAVPRLRPAARGLKEARVKVRAAEAEVRRAPIVPESTQDEDLAEEFAAIDELCQDLRRRIQLDQRMQKLHDTKQELDLVREGLLEEKVLSPRVLLVSGGIFSFGIMLAMSGIFLVSIASISGMLLTLVGIAGSVAGGWLKRSLGRAQQREWDAVQRQVDLLAAQQAEATEECNSLDALFADGRGPFAVQLRELEKRKSQLQQQLNDHDDSQDAVRKANVAAESLAEAKASYQDARRKWHRALHEEGLPAKLSPAAVRRLASRCREQSEVAKREATLRSEAARRDAELAEYMASVEGIMEAAAVECESDLNLSNGRRLLVMMDALDAAWQSQQAFMAERKHLRGQRWGLERRIRRLSRQLQLLDEQQARNYKKFGLSDGEDLADISRQCAEVASYQAIIELQESQLAAACDGICDIEVLWKELDGVTSDQLDAERQRLEDQCAKHDEKIREISEQRGRLGEQLLTLASDRRDAHVQLELARIRQRIKQSISRWHDLACTSQLLESIRRCYEHQRQPAALQEASLYLERITEGRYRRVWTRLDQETLCVDDAQGKSKPVSALSRGTREPLMLSLRLALVSQFARRGIYLPIVLDEVLVHFDLQRARAAAELLKEFALAGGHQIFMFTCHKHLVSLFTELGADVRLLPDTHAHEKVKKAKGASKAA